MKRGSNRGNNGYIGVNQANVPTTGVVGPNKLYNVELFETPIYPNENTRDALGFTASYTYNRPTEWPALPDVTAGTQQIVGLHAVYDNDSNVCAVQIQGAYNVDWGDGTTGAFASNTVATKRYDRTSYAGLTSNVVTSRGGAYKTALIRITPQTGQNLTTIDFVATPTGITGWPTTTGGLWLDIRMAGANVTTLTVSKWFYNSRPNNLLEQFEYVGPAALTSMAWISCTHLQRIVSFPSTRGVNSWNSMFHTCYSLLEFPASLLDGLINNGSVTSLGYTFYYMHNLRYFPVSHFNLPNLVSLEGTFTGCQSVERVPVVRDTSKVTTMNSMHNSCYNLKTFQDFNDTNALTNTAYMFNACTSMVLPPRGLSTGLVTNAQGMFNACYKLVKAPELNLSRNADFSLFFGGCNALRNIPQYDYSRATTLSQFGRYSGIQWAPTFNTGLSLTNVSMMWEFNSRLTDVPLITNVTNVTNISSMLNGCQAVRTIPGITFGNHTTTTNAFGAYNVSNLNHLKCLSAVSARGMSFAMDLRFSVMGSTALNDLYTNLATVGVSGSNTRSLQVSGNWGYTASDRMIAISKGWNVT